MSGIAFVGSTLPARIVDQKVRAGEIGTVLTSAPSLELSFQCLRQQTPRLHVSSLPVTPISQAIALLIILMKAKFSRRQIYIFHESCWPVMDLMIWLVRPNGWFLPQANMLSFTRLHESEARKVLRQKRLGRFWEGFILRLFYIYAYPKDAGDGILHVPAIRGYPSSIRFCYETALAFDGKKAEAINENKRRTVLFLVGTDSVETRSLRQVYGVLIEKVISSGFSVDVKDHPNREARLDLEIGGPDVTHLEPVIPAEMLDRGYHFAVGVGSAALATYGPRAISIVDLLDCMEDEVKIIRKRYLSSLNSQAVFPKSIEQLLQIIVQSCLQPETMKEG